MTKHHLRGPGRLVKKWLFNQRVSPLAIFFKQLHDLDASLMLSKCIAYNIKKVAGNCAQPKFGRSSWSIASKLDCQKWLFTSVPKMEGEGDYGGTLPFEYREHPLSTRSGRGNFSALSFSLRRSHSDV